MVTIAPELDKITATDFSGPHGVWVGLRNDNPALRGVVRILPGYPLSGLDPILDGLGVVLGDTLDAQVDERGGHWVDLFERE